MQSKYYTPEIEELFVGMDYQVLVDDYYEIWRDSVLPSVPKDTNLKVIRVKYLDHEDIESLGFEFTGCVGVHSMFSSGKGSTKWWLKYAQYPDKSSLTIKQGVGTMENPAQFRFTGRIKNKSELKRILKQIRYDNK